MLLLVEGFLATGMQEKSSRYLNIPLSHHRKFTLPYRGLENSLPKRPCKIYIADSPLVGGRLYHPELEDEIEVVPLQEIIAHFTHTPQDD
jgi:hypothetical protein